jgi:hypothetical protein
VGPSEAIDNGFVEVVFKTVFETAFYIDVETAAEIATEMN